MDPLHGHTLCLPHAMQYSPRRLGVRFFFIRPEEVPVELLCGRCAPNKRTRAGIMVSGDSLRVGIVTFMKNAAFDLQGLKAKAVPLEEIRAGRIVH